MLDLIWIKNRRIILLRILLFSSNIYFKFSCHGFSADFGGRNGGFCFVCLYTGPEVLPSLTKAKVDPSGARLHCHPLPQKLNGQKSNHSLAKLKRAEALETALTAQRLKSMRQKNTFN